MTMLASIERTWVCDVCCIEASLQTGVSLRPQNIYPESNHYHAYNAICETALDSLPDGWKEANLRLGERNLSWHICKNCFHRFDSLLQKGKDEDIRFIDVVNALRESIG